MSSSQAPPSRFLPTLTEVVQPDELEQHSGAEVPSDLPMPPDKVQMALFRLDRVIEQRVRQELDALVKTVLAEHVDLMQQRLHEEFQSLVREAAADALIGPQSWSDPKKT